MRKTILFSSLLLLATQTFAADTFVFRPECFSRVADIRSVSQGTIKVTSSVDFTAVQDGKLLAQKFFQKWAEKYLEYRIVSASSGDKDTRNINDNNPETAWIFDPQDKTKTVTIDLGKTIGANTSSILLDFDAQKHFPRFFISVDGKKYDALDYSQLVSFPYRYLRVQFIGFSKTFTLDDVKIYNLSIREPSDSTILLQPKTRSDIALYTDFQCDASTREQLQKAQEEATAGAAFPLDVNTRLFPASFSANPRHEKDFDHDGVQNTFDNCPFVTNADQLDSDGDRIGDACDLDNGSKEPFLGDSDHDGVPDNRDNCVSIKNANQRDTNSDGIGDACSDDDGDGILGEKDNCPNVNNADQKDVNANGVGDACEYDSDKDGIFDSIDNCIQKPNPDQKDEDNDGNGDMCDNCKLWNSDQRDEDKNWKWDVCDADEKYAREHDTDKDGKLDFEDNCPKRANPKQEDADKDGVGDVCDNCVSIRNADQKDENKNSVGDACEDADHDGIDGYKDNCPTVANADQKDSNNNGIGDVCDDDDDDGIIASADNCPFVYNPNQRDDDGDKKGNACDDKDDRYVESNRWFFIGAIIVVALGFIWGILVMLKKLLKK